MSRDKHAEYGEYTARRRRCCRVAVAAVSETSKTKLNSLQLHRLGCMRMEQEREGRGARDGERRRYSAMSSIAGWGPGADGGTMQAGPCVIYSNWHDFIWTHRPFRMYTICSEARRQQIDECLGRPPAGGGVKKWWYAGRGMAPPPSSLPSPRMSICARARVSSSLASKSNSSHRYGLATQQQHRQQQQRRARASSAIHISGRLHRGSHTKRQPPAASRRTLARRFVNAALGRLIAIQDLHGSSRTRRGHTSSIG